jgi:hypothetical protein
MPIIDRVLTDQQLALLTAVVDRIIPSEGEMPGAAEMGLPGFIEGVLVAQMPIRRQFIEGLAQIEIAASVKGQGGFGGLSGEDQDSALREVEAANSTFFDELVRQTYNGYYTNREVFQKLGIPEASAPDSGRQPDLLDVSLLERQRQRAPFWRQI